MVGCQKMNSWEFACNLKIDPGEAELDANLCFKAMSEYNANEMFWSTTVMLLVASCLCLGTYFLFKKIVRSRRPALRTFEFFAAIFDFLIVLLGIEMIYRASTALDSEIYDRDILLMKGISLTIAGALVLLIYRFLKRWAFAPKQRAVDAP